MHRAPAQHCVLPPITPVDLQVAGASARCRPCPQRHASSCASSFDLLLHGSIRASADRWRRHYKLYDAYGARASIERRIDRTFLKKKVRNKLRIDGPTRRSIDRYFAFQASVGTWAADRGEPGLSRFGVSGARGRLSAARRRPVGGCDCVVEGGCPAGRPSTGKDKSTASKNGADPEKESPRRRVLGAQRAGNVPAAAAASMAAAVAGGGRRRGVSLASGVCLWTFLARIGFFKHVRVSVSFSSLAQIPNGTFKDPLPLRYSDTVLHRRNRMDFF